jgi:hypothetical protein
MSRHRHRFPGILCALLGVVVCHPLPAEQAAQPVSPGNTATSTNVQRVKAVTTIPYSADEVTVITQTLADGTKITHKRLAKLYQDSQGRNRRENFGYGVESAGQDDSPQSVSIFDPVAGARYFLNPRERTAQKTDVRRPTPPPQSTVASANVTPARPDPVQPTYEDLGTQVIEGLEAKGERITRTIPAGADGNDQPMQNTNERWISTQPRLLLLSVTNDPRYGETVLRLTNLVLEEPPAELFQVPADYTVQELQPLAKPESPSD